VDRIRIDERYATAGYRLVSLAGEGQTLTFMGNTCWQRSQHPVTLTVHSSAMSKPKLGGDHARGSTEAAGAGHFHESRELAQRCSTYNSAKKQPFTSANCTLVQLDIDEKPRLSCKTFLQLSPNRPGQSGKQLQSTKGPARYSRIMSSTV
jgi:hypothetical protein